MDKTVVSQATDKGSIPLTPIIWRVTQVVEEGGLSSL